MQLKEPVLLGDIARLLKARLVGNPELLVTGINEIHKVQPGDITFVDKEKYLPVALRSPASYIILNKEIPSADGKAFLISDDPFAAFNQLTRHFRPFEPCRDSISPTAQIGEGTIIQPHVFIGNHVIIGKNCIIHANVSICDYTVIGNNVVIQPNTTIGGDAFYFKLRNGSEKHYDKLHSCGRVIIEDDVEIGAGCTIDRGVSGDTIIGRGTKIDNQVMIGHGVVIGKNCLIAAQAGIAGKTIVEDEVIIWGQVGISKDLRIGKGAVILAKSGVSKSLEGGKIYFGIPAEEARIRWRELSLLRKLPHLWHKLKELDM
ncbi:MAG: UDP-3-O-(3-hydroxymyristoyl)glucosamine N-acyltransferase [Chitinophagales bacterium]|nr:MAG: UDP-3-O-(3-hydroxymyristoyl)glucosamine N-acyltransferase [Chitinophagales bacterium]